MPSIYAMFYYPFVGHEIDGFNHFQSYHINIFTFIAHHLDGLTSINFFK